MNTIKMTSSTIKFLKPIMGKNIKDEKVRKIWRILNECKVIIIQTTSHRRKFYLRLFLTFYNQQLSQFV